MPVWRKASCIQRRKRPLCLKVCSFCVSVSGNERDDRGHRKGPKRAFGAHMKHVRRSWRDRKSIGCESGVRWERAGGWETREAAERMRAELRTDELHAKTPSRRRCCCYSLGGEGNRDKIKPRASSAHSPAAAHAANRQSFVAQPHGFQLLCIKIKNKGVNNSHEWSVFFTGLNLLSRSALIH